ncbi:MAG: tryptophan synthase subunit alpha [Candidatus Omnitrophica bacterium]|nr:tryptophan synthase subunit alpha [Candidatus Omnitrophota bacterium]MDD5237248.1 tryptophan synthase subunit alpha [Candidatus Omnitrophota bacterium]MDD5610993.1 tryptophan synthase subunit alpha [Candidatus Omnitrophota bacterium]
MRRIEKKFRELKKAHKKAFIAFITAGYPDFATTKALVRELEKRGTDIIELGVPFSDPLADGPVIQMASAAALKKGANLNKILELVRKVRKDVKIPLCLMSYYNPIFRFGEEKFLQAAQRAGVDGLIIPDLPPEEGKNLLSRARENNIDIILFVSPTTTRPRIKYISRLAGGFIYYVSLTGVTGMRNSLPVDLVRNLKTIKQITKKPVCVGFGISSRKHLRQVYRFSDGAIVGSAIVKKVSENLGKKNLAKKVGDFVGNLLK